MKKIKFDFRLLWAVSMCCVLVGIASPWHWAIKAFFSLIGTLFLYVISQTADTLSELNDQLKKHSRKVNHVLKLIRSKNAS